MTDTDTTVVDSKRQIVKRLGGYLNCSQRFLGMKLKRLYFVLEILLLQ
jgi:hypothetical protein